MKISVYGLGQFGYALLRHLETNLSEEHNLFGYDYRQEVIDNFSKTRAHPFLYTGHKIRERTTVCNMPEHILKDADMVILAVPSSSTLSIIPEIQQFAKNGVILVNTAKALDYETGKRLSILYEENLQKIIYNYALFSGGTIARDLFNAQILGAVVASEDIEIARRVKKTMESDLLRLQVTKDLKGVEYASAFKNVISILTGIIHGKGFGYGSETYILTKIAQEVEHLITHELDGTSDTFSINSQAWGNDMFMSATGKTRNREFGILLGKGMNVKEALIEMEKEKKTVEGIKTLEAINKITSVANYPLLQYLYLTVIDNQDIDLLKTIAKV